MDLIDYTSRLLERRDSAQSPLRIVQTGHPALRRRARPAEGALPDELLRELVGAMVITMHDAPGVGLAAPQVGLPLALFVAEDRFGPEEDEDPQDDVLERTGLEPIVVLDPSYEVLGRERVLAWEGCLSVDGFSSIVPRSRRVRLRGRELMEDGTLSDLDLELSGWSARIMQHETDHLQGTLCHDLAVPRSVIANRWVGRYADLPDAVRELGLTGEIETLGSGEVIIPAAGVASD